MTLTLDIHVVSFIHFVEIIGCNSFQKINRFHFFPFKNLSEQILRWHKNGQGQPRVIVCINNDGRAFQMLHTTFHCNLPTGSGEDI